MSEKTQQIRLKGMDKPQLIEECHYLRDEIAGIDQKLQIVISERDRLVAIMSSQQIDPKELMALCQKMATQNITVNIKKEDYD